MKLIDILVEELPKRGGWPKSANCITQDGDLKVEPAYCHPSVAKCDDDGFWFLDSSRIGGFEVDTLASDYTTAIITREQYEAALAEKEHPLPWDEKNKPCPTLGAECRGCPDCGRRVSCTSDDITDDAVRAEMGMNSRALDAALAAKNDGWIEWGGGECPVPTGTLVCVKWRDGRIDDGIPAKISHDLDSSKRHAIRWQHHGNSHDIIAYRLHQPQEAAQPKADDEADLNECIGQDAAQVWNGEGLPPVGCECESKFRHRNSADWMYFRCVAVDCDVAFGWTGKDAVALELESYQFRPIRSEAERKREEAVQALCDAGGGNGKVDEKAGYGSCWFDVYDAIAAGKIPGVKLED